MLERTTTQILNNPPARLNSFLSSRAVSGDVTEWEEITLSRCSTQATIRPDGATQRSASVPPLSDFASALATLACARLPMSPQLPATISRAPTLVLQSDEPTLRSMASKSLIILSQPSDEADAEMLRLVQDLAKEKNIPDWKPQVTQLKLTRLKESRVWISDAYTASCMSSLEIGPCQKVAHVLFLCDESLAKRIKTRNPALAMCEDYPNKHSAPKDLLDFDIFDNVCSWISVGSQGGGTMNHAVLLVSATGSTYAPAMALAYQMWNPLELIPDVDQIVYKLSETGHVVSLDSHCIDQLTLLREERNDFLKEVASYGRVESQTDVLKKDNDRFGDLKYAPAKPMPRQDSGASEYEWPNM